MKKFTKISVLACLTAMLAVSAYAAPSDCFDGGSGLDCDMLMTTLVPTMSTYSVGMKEAYVAQVRDDAAAYVAADGQQAASAVLQNAMDQARTKYPQAKTLTDLQLAQVLIGQGTN